MELQALTVRNCEGLTEGLFPRLGGPPGETAAAVSAFFQ